MTPPRVSFYTKGQRHSHHGSYIIVNQCYIQYRSPIAQTGRREPALPLLFIHGGGLTGAQWESTPDRRPGWAVLGAEAGYHVYVLDGVDSGRSQRSPDSLRKGPIEHRTAEEIWDRFRFGPPDGFEARKPFPDSQFPVEALDTLVGSQASRRRTTDEVECRGIIDAIRDVGECMIVAHSHGAALVIDALPEVEHLVKKLALIEPGGTSLAGKLTGKIPTLVVWGDYITGHYAWSKYVRLFEDAPVETMELPKLGLTGNSHFPMSDRNSSEVFYQILGWLEALGS
jgi:hypothetical protein